MKNEMLKTIHEYGMDKTAELLAEYINQKISSEDVATQFVLEEIEAASQGNEVAQLFAQSSGFDEEDYLGAMKNSFEEVDGPDGPQQEILNICMMLFPDRDLMAELRIKTVDQIMKLWKIGKYAAINENLRLIDTIKKVYDLDEGVFANINNDLNDSIRGSENIMIMMAYGYARRTVAAGLYLQGVFSHDHYTQARNIFKSLQLKTGQSVEFQETAADQACELLMSYDERLNRLIMGKLIVAVESNEVISAYDQGIYLTYDHVLSFFIRQVLN